METAGKEEVDRLRTHTAMAVAIVLTSRREKKDQQNEALETAAQQSITTGLQWHRQIAQRIGTGSKHVLCMLGVSRAGCAQGGFG
eukprot:3849974-Pleurochrysis_carterae.AAC.2